MFTSNNDDRRERLARAKGRAMARELYVKTREGLPVIPKLHPERPRSDGAVAICGECGRTIYQVEGYCCMNNRCPVQPRITF